MSNFTRIVAVILKTNQESQAPTEGTIEIQEWDSQSRTKRALKFGGLCWGMGVVAVFIPLLHFVLVPSFLIAGPIVAYWVLGQKAMIQSGSAPCPNCHKTMQIARTVPKFPISDVCNLCKESVKIELEPEGEKALRQVVL